MRKTIVGKPTIFLTGLTYFVEQLGVTIFPACEYRLQTVNLDSIHSYPRRLLALIHQLLHAKLWYQIGGYTGRGRIFRLAHMLRIPVVIHWVGTDVLSAIEYSSKSPQFVKVAKNLIHWAGAPWLVDELRSIGIESKFMPLPIPPLSDVLSQDPPPLPPNFTVLSYLPDTRPGFYGADYIVRLATEFPDVPFLIAGGKGSYIVDKPPNIRFLGWVDNMGDIYAKATVVVRITEHDGYGGTIQEALSFGRYAVWTYPFPEVFQAKDYSSLSSYIQCLLDRHANGLLTINRRGREYMKETMHPTELATGIREGLAEILDMQNHGQ